MKSITVQKLIDTFKLEVLAGASRLDRTVTRPRTHRPGLEFVGYFDFFLWNEYRCSGVRRSPIY